MTATTAPAGLHRTGTKADILDTAEALYRASGAEWKPGRIAKHVARHLDRDGLHAACAFVVTEWQATRRATPAPGSQAWVHDGGAWRKSARDVRAPRPDIRAALGVIDPTGQQAANSADIMRAARHFALGNLAAANLALDPTVDA